MSCHDRKLVEDVNRWLKGHEHAVAYALGMMSVAHLWDDVLDRDVAIRPRDADDAFRAVLLEVPSNPFFLEHRVALTTTLVNALVNWKTANLFERLENPKELELAFVLRSDYANLMIQCAYLVGGIEWATQVAPDIRANWTDETFEDYINNLRAEKSARAKG